jgi:hypothetical protein
MLISDLPQNWFGYSGRFAQLKLCIIYMWRHHRLPDLISPKRFTEMVQVRKLLEHDRRFPQQADKVAVKDWVRQHVGDDAVTPTLWEGQVLPDRPPWDSPFIIKSRHGAGRVIIVRSPRQDWAEIQRETNKWVQEDYGALLGEWGYVHVPRGIIVEPFIAIGPDLPIDYKFYVFSGKVQFVQVHINRATQHSWILFTPQWERLSTGEPDLTPSKPASLAAMLVLAERLGREHSFVRVDLYDVLGKPRFGEMTFYPGSGLDPFVPDSLDVHIGQFWKSAHW